MTRRRSSRSDVGEPGDGRRRRRYSKSPNWGGAILAVSVCAILVVIAVYLAKRLDRMAEAEANQSPAGTDKPADRREADAPESREPGRPAPKLEGSMIIQADALFREAKRLYAEALIAAENGKSDDYATLMDDCREKFKDLDAFFEFNTAWLVEAEENNWLIPKEYETLRRRTAKYGEFKERLPDKN